MNRRSVPIFLAVMMTTASSIAASDRPFLDPAQGEIDGKTAVVFLPKLQDESDVDWRDLTVHLAPDADLDQELVYPVGNWFAPPVGKYRTWMEGAGRMSRHTVVFRYGASPFRERGFVVELPLYPAGKVALKPESELPKDAVVRLLHVDSHLRGAYPQREMSRRARVPSIQAGVMMPEGPIIAAIFDSKAGEYIAIEGPLTVRADRTAMLDPRPPKGDETTLLAVLERPDVLGSFEENDVSLALAVEGKAPVPPSVLIPTANRIYAVWFGLSGRFGDLEIRSQWVFLEPTQIALRPGRVERIAVHLKSQPGLDVSLDLPEMLTEGPLSLRALKLPDREAVAEAEPEAPFTEHRFDALPAAELEIELETVAGVFRQRVDLSSGFDDSVFFAPEPFLVSGTVFVGDRGHPAVLLIQAGGSDPVEVATDEAGRFQATLFRPVTVVGIDVLGGGPPYLEMLDPPIRASGVRDFHLPANRYRVRVSDATTGQGIAGATVMIGNVGEQQTTQQSATSDGDGLVELPPLRSGEITVTAEAAGYLAPSETLRTKIDDTADGSEIEVVLEPIGEGAQLRLMLPDGRPAASAEVRAERALGSGSPPIWVGAADAQGELKIPAQAASAILLVRHPGAGGLIRSWSGSESRWYLPTAAPLSLAVSNPWGDAARWSQLAIWIEGRRLSGSALAWLTGTRPTTDRNGFWRGSNLPAAELRVLAWQRTASTEAGTGGLDSLATEIGYPWPELVAVTAID